MAHTKQIARKSTGSKPPLPLKRLPRKKYIDGAGDAELDVIDAPKSAKLPACTKTPVSIMTWVYI